MYPYYSNKGVWLKKAIRRNEYIFYTFNGVLRSNSWSMLFCLRKCSVSCGQGIRKRQVDCKSADEQRSLGCDLKIKPAVKEGCNIRPCPSWMTGAWGKVRILSGSVNHLIQFFKGPQIHIYGISRWFLFLVLQCSVTCGSGVKIRTVECSDKDVPCDAETKPLAKERCVLRECPQWITSPWEEVTVYMHIYMHIQRLNILYM